MIIETSRRPEMVNEVRFEIGCADVAKMLAFYTDVLGATIVSEDDNFKIIQLANVEIALWKSDNPDERGIGITCVVDDIKEAAAEIKKAKAEVVVWEDAPMALVTDPDGNNFSMMEDSEEE